MALNYERIGWENAPSTNTPIDAGSLNHMDNGILAVSDQYDVDVPYLQEQVAGIPAMLDSYLADQIVIDVGNWLDDHVTPGGSTIVVDDTLSIEGAAAESKTVGDALATKASQTELSEVETTLGGKADTDDVEALEEELNAEINQLKNALIEDSASGSIASFPDGGDGFAVRDLSVQMEPIQAGSGDPSPDNVRPISGRTAVTVTRTGVNIWDEELESGRINTSTGENTSAPGIRSKNFIPVVPSTTYYIKTPQILYVIAYDADKNYLRYSSYYKDENYTTQADVHYIRFYSVDISTYSHDISINYPSTDHNYHAYQGQSIEIQLGQTVYGGTLDVTTGVLTVDRAMVDLGTLAWAYTGAFFYVNVGGMMKLPSASTELGNIIADRYKTVTYAVGEQATEDKIVFLPVNTTTYKYLYIRDTAFTDATTFKTAMDGVQLVYELETPITVQLTAQQLTTLLGQNNVWSDADSVSVDYVADTKLYIAKVIAEALS